MSFPLALTGACLCCHPACVLAPPLSHSRRPCIDVPPLRAHAGSRGLPTMDLQLLEHRVRVTSIDKSGLWFYTHPIVKLLFLRHRTRCKFFSLTETPEDYTLMLDEEGFSGKNYSGFLDCSNGTSILTWWIRDPYRIQVSVHDTAALYTGCKAAVSQKLPQSDFLHVAENTWRVLNVLSNGIQTGGVTKIAKSVIAPLAEHNVSVLMLSTYQTDYILVRDDDLPVVFQTLLGELTIYKEENGELVRMTIGEASNGLKTRSSEIASTSPDRKLGCNYPTSDTWTSILGFYAPSITQPVFNLKVHPVQSPASKFCVLTLDRDTLPSIATILLDVLFYSHTSHEDCPAQNSESFRFFAFSLIDGYISIVMDTETQKKFPTNLLLTSSSGELWRMVRIGGQPLGFDECGIVAQIAGPLATADISAYYISTFNFDHALVPEEDIDCVIKLLHEREENKSSGKVSVLL